MLNIFRYLSRPARFTGKSFNRHDSRALLIIIVSLLLIDYLHYSTAPGISQLHAVYRYFYFLPIVASALRFGYWGGLLSALAVTFAFIPHILLRWEAHTLDAFNDLLVVFVFFGVALITGITTDRMRQAQTEQAETGAKLALSLERLQQQGEELRRAERLSSLGTLAGGLAHEIRNPVGIISASSQLLEMECGKAATETVGVIRHETSRIEQLIQELLNYAGDDGPKIAQINVCDLVEQVCKRLQPMADAAEIMLCIEVPKESFKIDGDALQIEKVLINLCMNAIQALNSSGTVTVMAQYLLHPKPVVQLKVIDDGPGIAPPALSYIFNPFYSTRDSGTGLGLSMVQRIVEDHNGQIEVESELGIGTTFTIEIPKAYTNGAYSSSH